MTTTPTAATADTAVGAATPAELMTVAAARAVTDRTVYFIGIGLPSEAATLARLTHAPNAVLIYESGTIDTKPDVLPLSIGDPELADTATELVSVPEIFSYWLQAGRIDVGFLGAAQVDRFANLNTTVIGDYNRPTVRLPGAGGAPEIATSAKEVFVAVRHRRRTFVAELDFITSVGHGSGGNSRAALGLPGRGPTRVITDLGILQPDPGTKELILTALQPAVTVEEVRDQTGWHLQVATDLIHLQPPTAEELGILRDLHARSPQGSP